MLSPLNSFNKRKVKVRSKIKNKNKAERSRVVIFRSNKNIYAQLINIFGNVVASYSSLKLDKKKTNGVKGVDTAALVGEEFAKLCVKKNIEQVVFDKGAYLYNGRVKAFAESCRKFGLKF